MVKNLKVWIPAGAAIVAAIISGVFLIFSHSGSATTQTQDRSSGCNNSGNGNSCSIQNGAVQPTANTSASNPPQGPGPWLFRVTNTIVDGKDEGLHVRQCDHMNCGCGIGACNDIGLAQDYEPLYAVCQQQSDYNGGDNQGNKWLKVKWPNHTPAPHSIFQSSPTDQYEGWVLSAYTMPAGHNGDIPTC
jgi:hypothetical protein